MAPFLLFLVALLLPSAPAAAAWIVESLVDGGLDDAGLPGEPLNGALSVMALVPTSADAPGDARLWLGGGRAPATRLLYELGVAPSTITSRFDGDLPAPDPLDARPRLFRSADLALTSWDLAYVALPEMADPARPRHDGFIAATPYTAPGEAPHLYVATRCIESSRPTEILRFDPRDALPQTPAVVFRSPESPGSPAPIRGLAVFGGRLAVALADGRLFTTDAPVAEGGDGFPASYEAGWELVAEAGDLVAASASHGEALPTTGEGLTRFHDSLLVASPWLVCSVSRLQTSSSAGGFWIFRGRPADGEAPAGTWVWEELARQGLGNPWHETARLCLHEGRIYASASAALEGLPSAPRLRDLAENLSRARGGIYRLDSTGGWILVTGNAATSPLFEGRRGSHDLGFWLPETLAATLDGGNFSLLVQRSLLVSHGGRLFASTQDLRVFLDHVPRNLDLFSALGPEGVEALQNGLSALSTVNVDPAGMDLHAAEDGLFFEAIGRGGFGRGTTVDGRVALSASDGLLLGLSDPFRGFRLVRIRHEADPPPSPPPASSGGGGCRMLSRPAGAADLSLPVGTMLLLCLVAMRSFRRNP